MHSPNSINLKPVLFFRNNDVVDTNTTGFADIHDTDTCIGRGTFYFKSQMRPFLGVGFGCSGIIRAGHL